MISATVNRAGRRAAGIGLALIAALLAGCERPPVDTVQRGYRGLGMEQVYNPRIIEQQLPLNALPPDTPPVPPGGPPASAVFKNVQVVGDLGVGEFTRLMVSITAWVAPQQGCAYCHKPGDEMSADSLYTKVVARKMLQMTLHINADWKTHVVQTGVTCYTCHRGQPVPANVWFAPAEQRQARGALGNDAGQNKPAGAVAWASLPYDPFGAYLSNAETDVRVIGTSALPAGNRKSIKQTEFTYGLMMHMSQALGVNCTYCHNTRSFAQWDSSTPQRTTAWYGIRLTRDLNTQYLDPLASVFPAYRLGPTGDVPKINCATCHQGAYKPLYGASMLATHPELSGVRAEVASSSTAPVLATNSAVLFFAVGSAVLTDEARKGLEQLIAALAGDPAAKVTISGFHSASGDLASNQELAKQRAFAVRDAFKSAGVAEERVVLDKPQSAEANLAGEDPKARRVEVSLK
jgi:photosynthetic reaction center cytochrome c subunit